MTTPTSSSAPGAHPGQAPPTGVAPDLALDERMRALEDAADAAIAAPSVHNSQPWTIVLHRDRLDVRADRSRRLTTLDPDGRELVQSLGAALLNARVALAASGWAVEVQRFPDPARPDLAAVVRPVPGSPEPGLGHLSPVLHERRTNRRGFLAEEVPDELLDHLAAAAEAEGAVLVPVSSAEQRRLVARLTRKAEALQAADPAYDADLRRWRRPPDAVPGRARLDSESGADRSFVLLATGADDPRSWLRAGEALERILLQLTRLGWAASPMTQALEIAGTRDRLRTGVTGEAFPQMLLRIGFAAPAEERRRRHRDDVVRNSTRSATAASPDTRNRLGRAGGSPGTGDHVPHPVSDGRGGTTWL
jgi:nitroreductase